MSLSRRSRLNLLAAGVSTLLSFWSGIELVGVIARPVHVVSLFFGGMGCGASLIAAMLAHRRARGDARSGPTVA